MAVEFRQYESEDYNELIRFFINCNEDKTYINWTWARFEWMFFHSEFDTSNMQSIGLWWDESRIVAASVYDMYFGEAFCGTLKDYEYLYQDVLGYAVDCLSDESGCGVAICDYDDSKKKTAQNLGMNYSTQEENIMRMDLSQRLEYELPDGMYITTYNPAKNSYDYQWLMWRGFDHGENKDEFENETNIVPLNRPNLNENLCMVVRDADENIVAHACMWYLPETDYVYVEPVFTLPGYRGKGLAKAVIYEGLNRCMNLGAKSAYVISDMDFYSNIGFVNDSHYTFWWIS